MGRQRKLAPDGESQTVFQRQPEKPMAAQGAGRASGETGNLYAQQYQVGTR